MLRCTSFCVSPGVRSAAGPTTVSKTTDGGNHWTNISRNPGLPKGVLGKIAVAISASRPGRVYALIEAAQGGLYRSDDSGATWHLMNNDRDYRYLASDFTRVFTDPQNPDTVYVFWMQMFRSTDS